MNIHPLAVVSSRAQLGHDVSIGPFCVIEDDVVIGDRCTLASRVVIKSGTTIGSDNQIFEGTVLGGLPQHLRVPEFPGRVRIGSHNIIRENVTVHRALKTEAATEIGQHNLIMVGAHIAHDCRLGNHIVFANNTMLGGHVTVEDRAFISGAVGVHQFCRIGSLAMVGGHARVVQDIPPFVTVDGSSGCIVGLNLIGLRRNGFSSEQIGDLKEAYRLIYRRGLKWTEILERLQADFTQGPVTSFHQFLSTGSRGFVQERRLPPGATIKLRPQAEEDAQLDRERKNKAG